MWSWHSESCFRRHASVCNSHPLSPCPLPPSWEEPDSHIALRCDNTVGAEKVNKKGVLGENRGGAGRIDEGWMDGWRKEGWEEGTRRGIGQEEGERKAGEMGEGGRGQGG